MSHSTNLTAIAALFVLSSALFSSSAHAQYYQDPYQQQWASHQQQTYHDGAYYGTHGQAGLDTQTHSQFGAQIDHQGNGFVGGQANVQSGMFAQGGAYQTGAVGNVDITNYAQGQTFVGTEAGAQAGFNNQGAVLGVNGFVGGRASGTVGTEVGAFGVGGTGEAWSGLGAEANAQARFVDGRLTVGGELGAALGVGGKLGAEVTIDVGAVGRDIRNVGQDVGRTVDNIGQGIGNVASGAGNAVKSAGQDIGRGIGNAVKGIGGIFK